MSNVMMAQAGQGQAGGGFGPGGKYDGKFLTRPGDDSMEIDQRVVGFLIGPGGKTLKEMKEKSGAKICIGEKGTEQWQKAKEIIAQKILECQNLPANRSPLEKSKGPPAVFEADPRAFLSTSSS